MRARSIIAASAASALLLTCSDIIPADPAPVVYAEETPESTALPDWVPDSHNAALRFFNLHGGTYIEDGLLCVSFCRSYTSYAANDFITEFSEGTMDVVSHTLYELPEENRVGEFNDMEVFVFRPVSAGSFTASMKCTYDAPPEYNYTPPEDVAYTFTVDEEMNITETDICAVLPDCSTEFDEYLDKYGTVSAHGDNIIFCLRTAERMFSEWKEGFVSDNVEQTSHFDCTPRVIRKSGGFNGRSDTCDLYVYKAASEGPVEVRWDVVDIYHLDSTPYYSFGAYYEDAALTKPAIPAGDARVRISDYESGLPVILDTDSGFEIHFRSSVTDSTTLIAPVTENPCVIPGLSSISKEIKPVTADMLSFKLVPGKGYSIPKKGSTTANADDHLTVTIVNGNAMELEYRVLSERSGDANGDEELNAADLVTLEKWLLGMPDAELKNWKACDLSNDNVVDAFDLCLMRQAIAESLKPEVITLMMVDEKRTHMTAGGIESYNRIRSYNTENLAGKDEILSLAEKISSNAETYLDMKPEMSQVFIADYGEDTLYIYYRRPGEDPERLAIASYGENCGCLPDDDIRQLVCLMIENGLFADEGASDIYKAKQ